MNGGSRPLEEARRALANRNLDDDRTCPRARYSPIRCFAQTKKKDEKTYEDITLTTKDGVRLRCTYYPGGNGKKTVPVIMLHGWGGRRGEFHELALDLQKAKHAVIVPDLRGHGRSTQRVLADGLTIDDTPLEAEKFNKQAITSMIHDVEAVKQFLLAKNNEGDLNIELLCVVGSEFGAILALNWAVLDWNAPRLPAYKQGQDVKALALISPSQSFKGLTTRAATSHPVVRRDLSIMIAAGDGAKDYSDAKRLHRTFLRFHTDASKRDLVFLPSETSLSGTQLLNARGLNADRNVGVFINERLVKRSDRFPWADPYESTGLGASAPHAFPPNKKNPASS